MNEQASATGEGNPDIERAEQQALGTSTYQKVEVVHRFADSHPWLHPLLIVGILAIGILGVAFVLRMRKNASTE